MLKDEFNRLMALFHEGAQGKQVNLQKLFAESLAFFEHLKKEFQEGSPEDRKEVLKMMMDMNKQILEESKKIMKSSGLSEDQLMAFAENPSNFSPEQWKEFQESKAEIHKAGQDLVNSVKKLMPGTPGSPGTSGTAHPIKPHTVQEIKNPESKPPKKPHRSDWTRG